MKIKLYYEPEFGDFFLKCPFCDQLPCDDSFQCESYSDRPMLWCDNCGARSFLSVTEDEINAIEKLDKTSLKTISKEVKIYGSRNTEKKRVVEFEYDLLFVNKIINYELLRFKIEKDIPEKKVRKFVESNYNKSLAQKYGIREDEECGDVQSNNFKLSVTCNSYNTEEPSVSYPKNFPLDHDGVHVYCLCSNNIKCSYWGD